MKLNSVRFPGLYCNLTFDYWDCWNFTRAGEVAVHPCPWWIPSSDSLRKYNFMNNSFIDSMLLHNPKDFQNINVRLIF